MRADARHFASIYHRLSIHTTTIGTAYVLRRWETQDCAANLLARQHFRRARKIVSIVFPLRSGVLVHIKLADDSLVLW